MHSHNILFLYTAVQLFMLRTYGQGSHACSLALFFFQHNLSVIGLCQINCADCHMSTSYDMLQ